MKCSIYTRIRVKKTFFNHSNFLVFLCLHSSKVNMLFWSVSLLKNIVYVLRKSKNQSLNLLSLSTKNIFNEIWTTGARTGAVPLAPGIAPNHRFSAQYNFFENFFAGKFTQNKVFWKIGVVLF